MAELGKTLLMVGALLVVVGGSLWIGDRVGLGRLPGDLVFRIKNVTLAFPLATCLVLSVVLTLALNLVFRGR